MRGVCMTIGCFVLLLVLGLVFSEGPANAQGKPQKADKGLNRALQMVPAQAQSKLLQAQQKGKGQQKGSTQKKGGKGKGKN